MRRKTDCRKMGLEKYLRFAVRVLQRAEGERMVSGYIFSHQPQDPACLGCAIGTIALADGTEYQAELRGMSARMTHRTVINAEHSLSRAFEAKAGCGDLEGGRVAALARARALLRAVKGGPARLRKADRAWGSDSFIEE